MITREDVKKLSKNATEYALMMNENDIEEVIIAFVEIKNMRTRARGPT